MYPAAAAAMEMHSLVELRDHFGVPVDLWQAFITEAGNPQEDIRLLAALPGTLVAAALSQAVLPGDVRLSAIQAAQVGLVWKLARRLMFVKGGGQWDEWMEEPCQRKRRSRPSSSSQP